MYIGFTGHRPNRLHIGADRVGARLHEALDTIRSAAAARSGDEARVAISPLAEGSDRLFALAALALGYVLWALLPFRSGDYEQTFADASTTAEYRALLQRATKIIELTGALADTKAAYHALGREMVDRSSLLVAVWDGRPAAGKGGTTEVIDHALRKHRPVIWINSADDHAPMLLRSTSPQISADTFDARLASSVVA